MKPNSSNTSDNSLAASLVLPSPAAIMHIPATSICRRGLVTSGYVIQPVPPRAAFNDSANVLASNVCTPGTIYTCCRERPRRRSCRNVFCSGLSRLPAISFSSFTRACCSCSARRLSSANCRLSSRSISASMRNSSLSLRCVIHSTASSPATPRVTSITPISSINVPKSNLEHRATIGR